MMSNQIRESVENETLSLDLTKAYNKTMYGKRKRGPAVKLFGNEVCQICNRKADGYHYNVLSCQGCKGFYRRTVLTKAEYICRTGRGGCDLKMAEHPRQRCQKCRIERCEEAGMCNKYVRRRKNRTRTLRILENLRRPTVIVESLSSNQTTLLDEAVSAWGQVTGAEKLKQALEPVYKRMQQSIGNNTETSEITSFIHLKIQLLVRYCMALKPFRKLSYANQMTVLSKTMIELCALHSFPRYEHDNKSIYTFDGSSINKSKLELLSNAEFAEDVFRLLDRIHTLKLSNDNIGILCCITLFSPDRNYDTTLNQILEDIQEEYVTLLRRHIQRNYGFNQHMFSRILGLLPTLRYWSEYSTITHVGILRPFAELAPRLCSLILKNPDDICQQGNMLQEMTEILSLHAQRSCVE